MLTGIMNHKSTLTLLLSSSQQPLANKVIVQHDSRGQELS